MFLRFLTRLTLKVFSFHPEMGDADLQNMGDRFVPYQGENYVDPIDALYDKVASSPKL